MTGFGVGRAPLGRGRVAVEVRSLNHRFLEVRVRMPSEATDQAFFVEQLCRDKLQRGRYDVTVRFEGGALGAPSIDLDRGKAVYEALSKLRDEVAPGSEVPLALLAHVPDLISSDSVAELEDFRGALEQGLSSAIAKLNEMRDSEGAALQRELSGLLGGARQLRDQIAARSPELAEIYRKRLTERVTRLCQELPTSVDQGRLETEVALLADRSDVAEELARLGSHFDQFASLMEQQLPIGRRLDFLLQEIAREANTIGAKCQDAVLSHLVVELKAEVERMREQVQNVE